MNFVKREDRFSGFSLIEVLLAFTVLAIGLMALAKLQVTMMSAGLLTKQQSEAIRLVNDKLEELKHYETLETTEGFFAYADIVSGSDTQKAETTSYTRTWRVTDNTDLDYKNVTISVAWVSKNGVTYDVTSDNIIGKVDPAYGMGIF